MKLLAILTTLMFCSCAEFGPFTFDTKWGKVTRDENGQTTLIPVAQPIVLPTK